MKFVLPNLLIFCLYLTACSGKAIDRDGGDLTRSEVEFISRSMQQAVEKSYTLLKHKVVNRYVDNLGQYLVSHNSAMPPLPYEFRVLKTNEVGVFSLPGGVVYITLGTLRAAEVEGQIAGAIAHELAHQQLNHSLFAWRKRVNAQRDKKMILDFDGSFPAVFLGHDGALALPDGNEEEADRLAPVILYHAKFDPRVYSSYMELLKKIDTLDPERVVMITMVHPAIDKRIQWVKDALTKIPPLKDPTLSSQSFEEIKQLLKTMERKELGKKHSGGAEE